jgi:hypothetical protein
MNSRKAIALLAILFGFFRLLSAQPQPLAVIDEPLPPIEAGVAFHTVLHATGGVPPYVWSLEDGELPEGTTLTADGLFSGRPAAPGSFELTLKVEDSAQPARSIYKGIRVVVTASLLLEWLQIPKVHDNRIDGSVKVSNGTSDTFDLTVVIVAVADNGRATAIGYEHFPLKPGTTNFPIEFGNTLPHGGYVIHADAIAEIPRKKDILRQRLETPQPLQVIQGP